MHTLTIESNLKEIYIHEIKLTYLTFIKIKLNSTAGTTLHKGSWPTVPNCVLLITDLQVLNIAYVLVNLSS